MNYAVIASDTNFDYAFFAPLTSLLFRKQGWCPLLFLVGDAAEWLADRHLRLALERSREAGAVIHFVEKPDNVKSCTVAQCVRIFAAQSFGVRLKGDDYLLTGDLDMFPLGPWVGGERDITKHFQLYFSNAYSGGPCPHDGGKMNPCPHFPICYIGATVDNWRNLLDNTNLFKMLAETPTDPMLQWNYDEMWLGERLHALVAPSAMQRIPRTFTKGEWRLDRSDWQVGDSAWRAENMTSLEGVADAHLPRPGFGENWAKIRPVLDLALSADMLEWADGYHSEWERA